MTKISLQFEARAYFMDTISLTDLSINMLNDCTEGYTYKGYHLIMKGTINSPIFPRGEIAYLSSSPFG